VSEFFATNAPDPLHLNQNSCIAGVLNCFATTRNSVRNGPNRCHYHTNSLNKVASEFFATNAVDPLHLTQNSCFRAFWTISLLHERRCKTGRTSDINAQFRQNEVASEFFAMNTPNPLHWTQNSCFSAFRTVLLLPESQCKMG
jgi:hypothetical protein